MATKYCASDVNSATVGDYDSFQEAFMQFYHRNPGDIVVKAIVTTKSEIAGFILSRIVNWPDCTACKEQIGTIAIVENSK